MGKFSKFMMFRLLENAFASPEIESRHFYSCHSRAKLFLRFLSSLPDRGHFLISPVEHFFLKIVPPGERKL